jgi:class I fructose-bisphosphate aldolase
MKSFRMNQLFDQVSQRCFVVAFDHGIFNEPGFPQGIENVESVIKADAHQHKQTLPKNDPFI